VTRRVEELLTGARSRIARIGPAQLAEVAADGGLVVDIRPEAQRRTEGVLPGALVIERNVLEWRLDPDGDHRIPEVADLDQRIVVVCSAGYASSLAAASLVDLGFRHAADLDGGYQAWIEWHDARAGTEATP
jgi:rhodanese-related sulfurtransferase